jgi:DNA polymerase-3 subunit gamma/tau
MTYLAIARTWRPRLFKEVVGQAHVVRALENALESGRVHHAFLFTGTRGVGKTTIARILAKALNCEHGVSATPCGECAACLAIDQGRFVDLIEVDAASRTGVDDTRELLDNVQYSPSSGRYKVYLIDEVHMLTRQSFNALLKTLEEPPPHVKFIFATTDPQKIPVTVLSRCLQFALKRLPVSQISGRIREICTVDNIEAEPAAIAALARAANGSLRDALSLLDQAIAYGNGALRQAELAELLGSLDRGQVAALLRALADGAATAVVSAMRQLEEAVPDYESLLAELATLLQRVALAQVAGTGALDEEDDVELIAGLADVLDAETTQLFYQIAVQGRRDLPLAPEPRTGFEMCMLRMLAFRPAGELADPATPAGSGGVRRPAAATAPAGTAARPAPAASAAGPPGVTDPRSIGDWPAFVSGLGLDGAARQLALHTALDKAGEGEVSLLIEKRNAHLLTDGLKARLTAALQQRLGESVRVQFALRDEPADTAAVREARTMDAAREQARRQMEQDPNVRQLVDIFDAELVPGSVRYTGDTDRAG